MWLVADKTDGVADGDPVTTWTDLSGRGNSATQATASLKPVLKLDANGISGRAVVLFDGTDDRMTANGASSPFNGADIPCSIVAVARLTATSGAQTIVGFSNSASANARHALLATTSSAQTGQRRDDAALLKTLTGSASNTAANVHSFVFSGTAGNLYLNGAQSGTADTDLDVGTVTLDQGQIGGVRSSNFLNGAIAEVVVYSRAIGVAERKRLERYLGAKYGIAIGGA